jgi:hypothetical protein
LVALVVSDEADGWLAEDEGWFVEAVLAGWLVEAAGWFADAELDGWLVDALAAGWFADADGWFIDDEAEALDSLETPGRPATFACFALSRAAWVFGPMMPSTGPGSKPLSFSACWSWRTDSSPFAPAAMLESLEGWLVEAEMAGWFAEAEPDGWLVEAAGWFAEADAAGWLAEAAGWFADAEGCEVDEADLSYWPAITEPAAIRAVTRASFLNSMACSFLHQSIDMQGDSVAGRRASCTAALRRGTQAFSSTHGRERAT